MKFILGEIKCAYLEGLLERDDRIANNFCSFESIVERGEKMQNEKNTFFSDAKCANCYPLITNELIKFFVHNVMQDKIHGMLWCAFDYIIFFSAEKNKI